MVSDKMAKAGLDSWAQFGKHQRDHKQVAQDIVNTAWATFDHNNEATVRFILKRIWRLL